MFKRNSKHATGVPYPPLSVNIGMLGVSFILVFSGCAKTFDKVFRSHSREPYELVTGTEIEEDSSKWRMLREGGGDADRDPSTLVRDFVEILPVGKALDIHLQGGRNAVFLAKKGFVVQGVDVSEASIERTLKLAQESKVKVQTELVELNRYQIPRRQFDLILCFDFWVPELGNRIKEGLKTGGVLVLEYRWHQELLKSRKDRPDFKKIFSNYQMVYFKEEQVSTVLLTQMIAIRP